MKHLLGLRLLFATLIALPPVGGVCNPAPVGNTEETMEHTMYSVSDKMVDGFHVYVLQQDETAIAEIVPALGNNCYAFRVAGRALIDEPPDLATLQERPTAYGNPILFPFPNRIRDGSWTFEGVTYQFDKPPDAPTTIHGLLLNRPYQVQRHAADENGATLVCTLDSRTVPDIAGNTRFRFTLR